MGSTQVGFAVAILCPAAWWQVEQHPHPQMLVEACLCHLWVCLQVEYIGQCNKEQRETKNEEKERKNQTKEGAHLAVSCTCLYPFALACGRVARARARRRMFVAGRPRSCCACLRSLTAVSCVTALGGTAVLRALACHPQPEDVANKEVK